ncbi:hypothetical protein BU24DRAFT_149333 [Aaosphaeria arxii CBS 175.79]|uniref:Uncharacterized protein n=1 Tax=Aaosphaeria arxii CBS 175.79 TaxID=1450172 RepID=A0A6A5XWN9_9PLEO|nr:uncharacterized protein BU24DRAFT_149333 [Aaosphaeria arxii CBS 175.79]KAF2017369.1 hypothetical protein BU24DRAFT_149333 [Aaosphaeria arxii CBS 175.79]
MQPQHCHHAACGAKITLLIALSYEYLSLLSYSKRGQPAVAGKEYGAYGAIQLLFLIGSGAFAMGMGLVVVVVVVVVVHCVSQLLPSNLSRGSVAGYSFPRLPKILPSRGPAPKRIKMAMLKIRPRTGQYLFGLLHPRPVL